MNPVRLIYGKLIFYKAKRGVRVFNDLFQKGLTG